MRRVRPSTCTASKPAITRALEPVLAALERARVSPDALTLAAVPIGALAGAAILLSPQQPVLLLLVPIAAGLRLLCNLLDGALARRTGRVHARGELLQRGGRPQRRRADARPGGTSCPAQSGRRVDWRASWRFSPASRRWRPVRPADPRRTAGVLSKPGRMALLSIFAVAVLIAGPDAWWPFGPLLVAGTAAHAGRAHSRGVARARMNPAEGMAVLLVGRGSPSASQRQWATPCCPFHAGVESTAALRSRAQRAMRPSHWPSRSRS